MADLTSIASQLKKIGNDLEKFLSFDQKCGSQLRLLLQNVFDHCKNDERASGRSVEGCPLQQLEVENFDDEQLWQQIQLQNKSLLSKLSVASKQLLRNKKGVRLNNEQSEDGEDVADEFKTNSGGSSEEQAACFRNGERSDSDHSNNDSDREEDEDNSQNIHTNKRKPHVNGTHKSSKVDDKFFKLAEMETFLKMEEKREFGDMNSDRDEVEGIDLFTDHITNNDSDGEELVSKVKVVNRDSIFSKKDIAHLMYQDFFDPPDDIDTNCVTECNGNTVLRDDNDCEISDGDIAENTYSYSEKEVGITQANNVTNKSTFEKQQEKLNRRITELEDSNINSKSWQLLGEASASTRPANSLLEEVLNFDNTTCSAPIITEETSKQLEDIIIQRIKDQTWDDVERKEKPVKEPYEYKKSKPLNQEKSKMSLSEIYEKEYLDQKNPVVEKKNVEHEEIQKMMKSLFTKLDALSNFQFTPKPPVSEIAVVANMPSITIEESAPVNVSTTTLLAPEEVYDKNKEEVKGQSELTRQDRKHNRRLKKKRQRIASKEKEKVQKLVGKRKPGLNTKYSKAEAAKKRTKESKKAKLNESNVDSKSFTSSSAFFAKLQDSVRNEIHGQKTVTKTKTSNRVISAQFKL